jgi:hypothetical protein
MNCDTSLASSSCALGKADETPMTAVELDGDADRREDKKATKKINKMRWELVTMNTFKRVKNESSLAYLDATKQQRETNQHHHWTQQDSYEAGQLTAADH